MELYLIVLAFTFTTSVMAVALEWIFYGYKRVSRPCFNIMLVIMLIPYIQFAVVVFILAQFKLHDYD